MLLLLLLLLQRWIVPVGVGGCCRGSRSHGTTSWCHREDDAYTQNTQLTVVCKLHAISSLPILRTRENCSFR
uniref:Putative secreted protein n=1 Tax=Anopheles darlingi TaxID=43151 RepID=A0A2M4DKR1_ANODA